MLKTKNFIRRTVEIIPVVITGLEAQLINSLEEKGFVFKKEAVWQFGIHIFNYKDYRIRIQYCSRIVTQGFEIYKVNKLECTCYADHKSDVEITSELDLLTLLDNIGKWLDIQISLSSKDIYEFDAIKNDYCFKTVSQHQRKPKSKPYSLCFDTKYEEMLPEKKSSKITGKVRVWRIENNVDFRFFKNAFPDFFHALMMNECVIKVGKSYYFTAMHDRIVMELKERFPTYYSGINHLGYLKLTKMFITKPSILKKQIKITNLNSENKVIKNNGRAKSKQLLAKELESYKANKWFYEYLENERHINS